MFVEAINAYLTKQALVLATMPAINWLRSQYSFKLATKSVLKRNLNLETIFDDYKSHALKKLTSGFDQNIYDDKEKFNRLNSRAKSLVSKNYGGYLKGVISAFHRYFYTEIDSFRENIQSAKIQAEKAKSHIDTLIDIEETLSIFPELNRNLGNMNYEKIIRLLKRTSLELGYISNGDNNSYTPIQKHDERAKERMLIFCLWRHFRKYKNSSNTTAISNMLTIEGVENQITQRAIDNLISKWKLPPPTIEIYEDSSEVEPDERTQLRDKLKLRF
jgi:hypothetical protein